MEKYLDYFNFNDDSFSIFPYDTDELFIRIMKENSIEEYDLKELLSGKEFFDLLKTKIPKTIKKLEIPFDYIKYDFEFLKEFPNLTELNITSYGNLDYDIIKRIQAETKIRKMSASIFTLFEYKKLMKEDGFTIATSGFDCIFYKDLQIISTMQGGNDYINIYTKNIDKETIEKLSSIIKNKKIYKVNIYEGDKDINLISLDENENNEIEIDFISDKEVDIKVSSNEELFLKTYNYLSSRYKINKCVYKNMSILNYSTDKLDIISNECDLKIIYDINEVDYEEYKGLYETIKYYRMLINENNLSPVEKVMYAYDIMKTFPYNESKKDVYDSRDPHRIVETGNIVCVGYSDMLRIILNGLDNNIKITNLIVSGHDKQKNVDYNHARNIIRIDDNKYNIHGIYSIDATWDSVKENISGKLGSDYTALDLYTHFLIPITKDGYSKIYSYEEEPIIDGIFKTQEFHGYEKLFNHEINKEILDKYLNVERPSLETFISMLTNVRLSEGFNKEQIEDEIKKVIEKNNIVVEEAKKNDIYEEFFRSK